MIKDDIKQQIIDRADILEVVGDFVKLKKAGSNYQGRCPFHNEKTPSFSVNPSKQFFHCFGCGVGGDAVKFIMDHEKKNFPEALRYLAAKYNIIIEESKPDPEYKKKEDEKEKLFHLNELALKFYHSSDRFWTDEQTLATEYMLSRFSREEILQWKIGLAPNSWNALLDHFKKSGVKEEFIKKSDLFGFSEKTSNFYDYFRARVLFPINDHLGRVAGFGGRELPGAGDMAKYLNSPESSVYNKSGTLYGLSFARKEITKQDNCHIVEGYTDVISMHTAGITNTVAPCGTALTKNQLLLLKRYTKTVTLIYDGDTAGKNAAKKNGRLAIQNGFNVYICLLPDGEDPDSFFRVGNSPLEGSTAKPGGVSWIEENRKDYILQLSAALFGAANGDPLLRHEAINDICGILFHLDKGKQDIYIEQIAKASKQKTKLFSDKLSELKNESEPTEEKTWLPPDVDANEFEKWGFYSWKNEYYFRGKGGIEKYSNFIMKPIFHITSIFDSRRIFELVNVYGYKVVVNLDMQMITSLQAFQKEIEARGNFMFYGQMTHLQKLKLKLYEDTRTCEEIKNLGWQKEGFWSWANGIMNEDGSFQEIDEYGVVDFKETNFFIPAFSKIYLNDKSVFLDERKFQFKKGDINISDWTELYTRVHGENSMIGFAFYIAALFRDHLLYLFDNFPILNLFGPKGSGKNTMAYSLLSLFGKKQTEFNIHNGTKPGLAKHLENFNNAIAFIDEYKNSLDFDKIETLKSIYNAIGRSRMNMDKGGKKETTQVNQAVILAGQEMPTIDVALSSRVIFLQFLSKKGLSAKEKSDFEKLQKIERDGLPHISVEFLKHRKYFIQNYKNTYDQVLQDFMDSMDKNQIDDRILRNMVTVCAAFKTLESKFDFSFTYDQLKLHGIKVIQNHNDQLSRSDEIGIFWSLMEALFDENVLIDKWHFKVKMVTDLRTTKGKMDFKDAKRVLRFKFSSVAKIYSEHLRRRGDKPLPIDSLRYYLETSKSFIGIERSSKFVRKDFEPGEGKIVEKKQITTAYCFDYDMLNINLDREDIEAYEKPNGNDSMDKTIEPAVVEAPEDKLPF